MKIVDAAIIAKAKFATFFAVSYLDRKGNAKKWNMVSRCEQPKCMTGDCLLPDAAIIVPYNCMEDKLVVIKEYRVPLGDYQYGFPAGLLDPDESVEVAARRELQEETGLNLVKIYRYSPAVFSSAGITDEAISLVFAEVEGTPSIRNNTDSEDIEVFMMDRREVMRLLQRTDIFFGARAWLVLDAFSRMGRTYFTGE